MAEMASPIEVPENHTKPKAEEDPALKARRQLQETLSPSERVAGEIRNRVFSVGQEMLRAHPHAEMKRIVQNATGVFLWEHMALGTDIGEALPVGLTMTMSEDGKLELPSFDNRRLSKEEYEYVVKAFRERGVVDEVVGIVKKDREGKQGDITRAVDQVLRLSPTNTFLETFSVTPRQEKHRDHRTLVDLTDQESAALRSRLEAEFSARYAPQLNGQSIYDAVAVNPTLAQAYRTDVLSPVAIATKPGVQDTRRPESKNKEVSKEQFRAYVDEKFIGPTYQVPPSEIIADGDDIIPHDYAQWSVYPWGTWPKFVSEELQPLDESFYKAPRVIAEEALTHIGPRLYDQKNTADSRSIIDQGYKTVAQRIADKLIHQPYRSLTEDQNEMERALHTIMWLQGARGPLHEEDAPYAEELGQVELPPLHQIEFSYYSAYDLNYDIKREIGKVTHISPEILSGPPRQIVRRQRNNDLPDTPDQPADLVIVGDYNLAQRTTIDSSDTLDPQIVGMKLIARNDQTCYYARDPDNDPYKPVTYEIPYIKQRHVADHCREIGLIGLADELDNYDKLTIAQLTDIMKKHVRYAVPDRTNHNEAIRNPVDWEPYIGLDGKLQGQSKLFAEFTEGVLRIIYTGKRTPGFGIGTDERYVVANEATVFAEKHYQTYLVVPSEGINAIIDISPPPAALADFVEHQEKIPPPPPPPPEPYTGPRIAYQPYEPPPFDGEYLRITTSDAYKELLHKGVGKIDFVEPVVFERTKQWMFSQAPRDDTLPTFSELAANNKDLDEQVVLQITTEGTNLADKTHDPVIAGMKLVARENNSYMFIIDQESTVYKPVEVSLKNQVRNDLAIACLELGMSGLAQEIKTVKDLTVEDLRQLVQAYCKYDIPDTGEKTMAIKRLSDLKANKLIDDEGLLRGQCDTFEFFMRSLLIKAFGEDAVKIEGGHTLCNTPNISLMMHAQTRLTLPDLGINALIDVEPRHFDIPDLGEKPMVPEPDSDSRGIIRKKLSKDEIDRAISDIRSGRTWPEDLKENRDTPPPEPRGPRVDYDYGSDGIRRFMEEYAMQRIMRERQPTKVRRALARLGIWPRDKKERKILLADYPIVQDLVEARYQTWIPDWPKADKETV